MTGRRNHARTDDERLAERQTWERLERGEKLVGTEAGWLDRRSPARARRR